MIPSVDDLRARLGVGADITDAQLGQALDVSVELVDPWVPADQYATVLYGEAVLALAVKVWDVQPRGVGGFDASGEFIAPSPNASAGMIRAVWAYIQAMHPTGGLTA